MEEICPSVHHQTTVANLHDPTEKQKSPKPMKETTAPHTAFVPSIILSFNQQQPTMPPPSTRPGKAEDGEAPPSNNLWVGNLSADVTNPELASLFGRHGTVDNVTSYPSRSYAFVFFKRLDDARKAKDALQGAPLHGNALKIEFASTRPGKAEDGEAPPSNNLWVGNLSADVTDPELASLFGRHGAVDNVTSYPSRSYAFVFFKRLDDARKAKDALQGAPLHGNALKIEFAKPL
ncbi:hypothetical protein RJ640_008040 [Escallonia rubra]|uniref:RRM domain-containing protein n=1 Tax=Escallonia rubra TaxID=112253 RepID=A0AA88RKC5_9ASTE|nr:hypothetical protein RJ640_008040 [Escallonia rubra]